MFRPHPRLSRLPASLALASLLIATAGCGRAEPEEQERGVEAEQGQSFLSRVLPTRQQDREVPAGTEFPVVFAQTVSSATAAPGESFRATVAEDVAVEGAVAIPEGSQIVGTVSDVVPPRKIGGRSRMTLVFHTLELPGGETERINALLALAGPDEAGKDAATIIGSAFGGALLGRVIGGGDRKERTLIGAAVGAAAGTAIAAAREGEPVVIAAGTELRLRLEEPVTLPVTS